MAYYTQQRYYESYYKSNAGAAFAGALVGAAAGVIGLGLIAGALNKKDLSLERRLN